MKKLVIFPAIIFAVLTAPAAAHGPTPQKVQKTIAIDAEPARVWDTLKAFDRIADWHPQVSESIGDGQNLAGRSERTLTLQTGGQITEGLDDYDPEKFTLSYRLAKENVEALPVSSYSAILRIESGETGGSTIEWKCRLYRGDTGNFPKPDLNDEAAVNAMNQFFETGLKGLKEFVEKSH